MKPWWAVALLLACAGCAGLPSLEGRGESYRLADTSDTRIARGIADGVEGHPGKTGVLSLRDGTDAFAARMLFASVAEKSIDAQYYIWHADQTGLMLMRALRISATHGVRVRVLLDDQNTNGLDDLFADFAATPNLELRLYNPFTRQYSRLLQYVGDFSRVNRRMHNKSFIVDGRAAIVGGRNIGNEYFGAGDKVPFKDLDVIAVGAAVDELSAQFDLYWNSASAYPSRLVLVPTRAPDAAALDARLDAAAADPVSTQYLERVRNTPLLKELDEHHLPVEWVDAVVVRDDPAKTLTPDPDHEMLALTQVLQVMGVPQVSFDLISPYFVTGAKGTEALEALVKRGVRVRVLTNSYEATDVAIVHSGYAKRRCELARAGVQLYELKPEVTGPASRGMQKASSDSSAASLHAKTFQVDDQHMFVGSFNFDPRSALINTELGLVMHSPAYARRLDAVFNDSAPRNAYLVHARSEGACVEWIEQTDAGEVRYEDEPHTTALSRMWLEFLMLLPIDWLL
jgi:putative cardiolipin synthase